MTDGDAGGAELGIPRPEMGPLRRDEQVAAATIVGVEDVRFLGYPDGAVEATLALRRDLARVIRQVRPQRVVGQSPERTLDRIYASHPDHLATGIATLDAVYPDARNRWAHPELEAEGLEPHTVGAVWLTGAAPDPMHYSDITDALDRKIEALLRHQSQHARSGRPRRVAARVGSGERGRGRLPEGRFAEFVRVVVTL